MAEHPEHEEIGDDMGAAVVADALPVQAALDAERLAAEEEVEARERQAQVDERLAAALQVNRTLRAVLAERQRLQQQFDEETARFDALLARQAVEGPVRKAEVERVQGVLGTSNQSGTTLSGGAEASRAPRQLPTQSGPHVRREALMLAREVEKLEGHITTLSEENAHLADKHQGARTQLQDSQSRVRALHRRERYLAQDLKLVASRLTQASVASSRPTNFLDLPGFCVSNLVAGMALASAAPPPGHELAPPEVRSAPDRKTEQSETILPPRSSSVSVAC